MNSEPKGTFSFEGIEKIIHEKARLSILTSLFVNVREGCDFNELKQLCSLTDGNLSRHLQILEEYDLISIDKSFENRRPRTHCKLTRNGKKRYRQYLEELEKVISAARGIKPSVLSNLPLHDPRIS